MSCQRKWEICGHYVPDLLVTKHTQNQNECKWRNRLLSHLKILMKSHQLLLIIELVWQVEHEAIVQATLRPWRWNYETVVKDQFPRAKTAHQEKWPLPVILKQIFVCEHQKYYLSPQHLQTPGTCPGKSSSTPSWATRLGCICPSLLSFRIPATCWFNMRCSDWNICSFNKIVPFSCGWRGMQAWPQIFSRHVFFFRSAVVSFRFSPPLPFCNLPDEKRNTRSTNPPLRLTSRYFCWTEMPRKKWQC